VKTPIFIFAGLIALLLSMSRDCRSDDHELLNTLLKTVSWVEGVGSHHLELQMCIQTESDRPSTVYNQSVRDAESNYFESIAKVRTLADAKEKSFAVVSCIGISSFGMNMSKNGVLQESEDETEMSVVRSVAGEVTRYDQQGRKVKMARNKFGRNALSVAGELTPGLNLPLFPLLLYQDSNAIKGETNIEFIIDELIDSKESRLRVTSEEIEKNGKMFRVWRFVRQGIDVDMGFRFVVSNEGVDKGLVVEFHEGLLKKGSERLQYTKEGQLTDQYLSSNLITWKKYLSGDEQTEYVLPVSIVKTATITLSGKKTASIRCSFDWKSFDPPDSESMSLDQNLKVGKQFRKDIDLRLRR
jgi:hypothetical protein